MTKSFTGREHGNLRDDTQFCLCVPIEFADEDLHEFWVGRSLRRRLQADSQRSLSSIFRQHWGDFFQLFASRRQKYSVSSRVLIRSLLAMSRTTSGKIGDGIKRVDGIGRIGVLQGGKAFGLCFVFDFGSHRILSLFTTAIAVSTAIIVHRLHHMIPSPGAGL